MTRFIGACVALVLLSPSGALGAEYVNDPLTSDAFPGRGSKGGTFSASGWTTVNEPDAVWWEIADALSSGHVEFTVTGISLTTLTGADHDIFTMYQAPTGQAEPIAYSPYFRNNDFKTFTRIFGVQEPGRAGAMKLELAFCPRGEPWYHDEVCPASCDGSGLAYANGTDKDVGWDGAQPYTIAIDWGGGQMTFSRNGAPLGNVSYPGDWSPQPLRVRLGSPRHDGVYPGLAMMPIGITFKNMLITGTPGVMTPICGAVVPDGGTPPPDSGSPDAGAPSDYAVLADVSAASWEPGVFSDVTDLNVEAAADGTPTSVVYLRFPALSGVVTSAVLHLRTAAMSSAAGGSGVICVVADDSWDENTMTWATRPAVGSTCAGTPFSVDPDTAYEWDVTALLEAGQHVNLAVVSHDQNGAHYLSKESGGNGPRLSVTTTGASGGSGGSGGVGGSANGGVGGGWGTGGQAGSGASAAASARGSTSEQDDGCGCRSAGGPASSLFGAAIVALLGWFGVRRRSRRARAATGPTVTGSRSQTDVRAGPRRS